MQNKIRLMMPLLLLSMIAPATAQRWSNFLASQEVPRMLYNSRTHTYWFGTTSNLLWRFNGQQFDTLSVPDSRVNGITALAIDEKKDALWVGTRFGLFHHQVQTKKWAYYNLTATYRACSRSNIRHITALLVASNGTLWYGFDGTGVGKRDSTGWFRYTTEGCSKWDSSTTRWVTDSTCTVRLPSAKCESNYIDCIAEDKAGNMYFGTRGAGLLILDRQATWTVFEAFPSDSNKSIQAIAIDRHGNKWLGTPQGVCLLNSANQLIVFNKSNSGLADNNVKAIWLEAFQQGDIKWFATGEGVSVLDSAEACTRMPTKDKPCWKTFSNQNSGLATNDVQDIMGDRDGNLWFALSRGGGVSRFNNNWSELTIDDGLSSNFNYAVEKDSLGRLWVGTDVLGLSTNGRFDVLNNGIWRHVELNDDARFVCFLRPRSRDFLPDGADMWIATTGCGIFRVSKDFVITQRIRADILQSNNVFKLALYNQRLWAGTDNGLVPLFIDGQVVRVDTTIKPVLPSNYITALANDYGNRLWVGTVHGLSVYDGQTWTDVPVPPFPANTAISAIAFDARETLWVGTPHGVARFDSSSGWASFSQSDGLPDVAVSAIEVAPDGTVWVGTFRGAAAFAKGRWTSYTSTDGPRSDFIYQIAFGPADVVWFATWGGGAARYHHTEITPNTFIEKPFRIVTEPNVTFYYSGYDFNTPTTNLRYQYALDDTIQWSFPNSGTSVKLFIASDGPHTFYVRAIDQDGNVDSTAAILRFNKVSPNLGRAITLIDPALGPNVDSLWLYLPPAVLTEGSSIRVNSVTVDTNAVVKQDPSLRFTGIAFALALQPENDSFVTQRPISLKIFYDDSSVAHKSDQNKLAVYRREGRWVPLGGTVGAEPPVIATTITQLDTFALFEKKSAIQELASTDLTNLAVQPRILSPQYAQTVTISFDLGQRAEVTAKIYNLAGRFVQVLCESRSMNPGSNTIEWNGGDYNDEHCPSGLYIICVQANGQTATKTVMVVNK